MIGGVVGIDGCSDGIDGWSDGIDGGSDGIDGVGIVLPPPVTEGGRGAFVADSL
jgi:hypothetical protein